MIDQKSLAEGQLVRMLVNKYTETLGLLWSTCMISQQAIPVALK